MTRPLSRRDLFRRASGAALGAAAVTALGGPAAFAGTGGVDGPLAPGDPWSRATWIKAQVRGPRFASRWFDVTAYGAVGDGSTMNTDAFRDAIRACNAAGGGHVIVPTGSFLTGPIHLLSNVDLHVTDGARVLFSQDPDDYLPVVLTRFEGVEVLNYSPLIYAFEQQNIGVTGTGILDGQADNAHWWPWCGSSRFGWKPGDPSARSGVLNQMAEDGVPVEQRVFGDGGYLRPSFIEPYRCSNVVISDVTIVNSPMWELHPTLSDHVLVEGVKINSHGPNNDGCDPESSRMVVIRDCTFDTGDDCIAIKAGKNADGRRVHVPSEDILIEDCLMKDGHGGVTIGSEMTGGVRNVFTQNCQMSSPNLNIALRFKTNSLRGGYIHGVHARNIDVGQVGQAVIDINFYYGEGPGYGFPPAVGDINVSNLTVGTAQRGLNISGYPDDHINGIRLTDVDFGTTSRPDVVEYVDGLVLDNVVENGQPLTTAAISAA